MRFLLGTVPRLLRERVHPPLDFTSTSENWPRRTRRAARTAQHLPRGFFPLRDTSRASPLAMGFPCPIYVPSTAFLTLSTAYSSLCLAGLFHPTATCRICLSGVFPAAQPTRLIAESSPALMPLVTISCTAANRVRQIRSLRLQGLIPSSDP